MTATRAAAARASTASINQEQLVHELEQKYLKLKADAAVLESERDALGQQKLTAVEESKKLQDTIQARDVELTQVKEELLQLRSERDQLSFKAKAATSLAGRRLTDIEELQATVKEQSKQLIDAQRQEVEALHRAAEQEAMVEPLKHSVQRVNKELDTQKEHLNWMETQLSEKTKKIQELRSTLSTVTHDHEELKMTHTEELTSAKRQLESSRQTNRKLESSLAHIKEELKELQTAKSHEEERFQGELSAQRRLAGLYKESAEDANTRVKELQEVCDSLRKSLAESDDALAHETERTKQQVEHLFQEQAEVSENRIGALQDELKEAKQRIEEMEKKKILSLQTASAVADLSSAAGEAHLASHGITPKQMYDQIMELEQSLREERDEKEKLQIYMDRIVKEVHEKAPMIMGLKLEHERAIASHGQISERLDACMQELTKYRSRERQAWNEKQAYEGRCESLAKSVDDLSRQVQHLLFRAHEQTHDAMVHRVIAPGEVVSENLVVFKDVEELQKRNQQLLMVIREMTESKKRKSAGSEGDTSFSTVSTHLILAGDSDNESDDSEPSSEIGKRLSMAQKEIDELRAEREEERQMIAAIVKQRDMYRVLLAQADSKFTDDDVSPPAAQSSSTNGGGHARRASTEFSDVRALRELQKEFDAYKKEKQANVKLLQESLDQVRTECSAARLSQMHADVESKYNKERVESAEERRQVAEDEIMRLRGKMEQLNSQLLQHQKLLADSEARLETITTHARTLEVEKDGAMREVSFLKKHEERALEELRTVRLDNTNLLKMMDASRHIEASRESREQRESDRLSQKVVSLENKLQETYDKLEASEALSAAKLTEVEQSKKIAVIELEEVRAAYSSSRENLVRLEEQRTSLETKSKMLEDEVAHLRDQLKKGAPAAANERVASLEVQLREAQREMQSSMEIKKSLTDAVAKYKAIAEANEKNFADLTDASQKWKASQEDKVKLIEAEKNAVKEELEKMRMQVKEHVTEGNKWREDIDRMEQEHKQALFQHQEKEKMLQLEVDGAQMELGALRDRVKTLRADLAVAQENYERELKLHASEVEKYSSSRKLVNDEQTKNLELMSRVAELNARTLAAEKETVEKTTAFEKLLKDAVDAKNGLTEQNKLLHAQLERSSHQLRRLHDQEMIKTVEGRGTTAGERAIATDQNSEIDDLRSVISFLRKENEIATSKFEVAQEEHQRARSQISALEATLERLRDDMKRFEDNSSKESSQTPGDQNVSESAKRFAQLEQLNLLRESNATLRDESQKNFARFKAEEERCQSLEAQLEPLRRAEATLTAQIETLKQEIAAVNEANKRWKQRVEQLVERYQQVDPAEYEKVCAEKLTLTKQLAELQTTESSLRAELEALKSSEGKITEEEKLKAENLRKQYDRIKGFAKSWKSKAEGLTKQVTDKTKEAEEKATQMTELQKKLTQCISDKSTLEAKVATLESAKMEAGGANAAASASWEKERQDMQNRVEMETKKVTQLKDMNSKLLTGVKSLRQENTMLKGQLSAVSMAEAKPNVPVTTAAPSLPAAPTSTATTTTTKPTLSSTVTTATSASLPPLPPAQAAVSVPVEAKSVTTQPKSTPSPTVPMAIKPSTSVSTTVGTTTTMTTAGSDVATTNTQTSTGNAPVSVLKSPTRANGTGVVAPPRVPPSPPNVQATMTTTASIAPGTTAVAVTTRPVVTAPVSAPQKPAAMTVPSTTPIAPPSGAAAPTPVTAPVSTAAAAAPPVAVPVSAEEKLRLFALQSMKKQFMKPPQAAAKPVEAVQPPLPSGPPPSETTANGDEVNVSSAPASTVTIPPSTGPMFGAFGSGNASSLVFGKPGISLPIPSSPIPSATVTMASKSTPTTITPSDAAEATESGETEEEEPAVIGTEVHRRSQRLARFGTTATATGTTSLKRPAPAASAADAPSTPLKMAKVEEQGSNAAATTTITTTTTTTAAGDQTTETSQKSEEDAPVVKAPATSPPTQTE